MLSFTRGNNPEQALMIEVGSTAPPKAAQYDGPTKPVHIVLYALIPAESAHRPIQRRGFFWLRNQVRRLLELARWRFLGRWRAHHSTFKDATNTNRGDIAIRLGVRHLINQAFQGHALHVTEIPWGELDRIHTLAPHPDLLIIGGGGFLFADKEGRLPPRFAADVAAISMVSCPVVAASVGLNNLMQDGEPWRGFHSDSRSDIRTFLAALDLISVRDHSTSAALEPYTSAPPPVIVDPAFLLAAPGRPSNARGDGLLSVGLNLAFHGAHTAECSRHMLPLYVNVLKALNLATPCRFTYFVHSDAERGIASALKLSGIDLEIVDAEAEIMIDAYRRMDIHICQMLHSAILATSVGTPTLNLAYDIKSASFFDLLGLPDLCRDARHISEQEVLTAVKAMIAQRHHISATLFKRRAELAQASNIFYSTIAQQVLDHRALSNLSTPAAKLTSKRLMASNA